jgi:hypothetical protein
MIILLRYATITASSHMSSSVVVTTVHVQLPEADYKKRGYTDPHVIYNSSKDVV